MALIPLFHVIADEFGIDSNAEVIMGEFVKFDSATGLLVKATGAVSERAIGLAGDTKSSSTSGMPTLNGALIGMQTTKSTFVNRVSDGLTDETKASAKMTVYHSGGKFATNMYDTTDSFLPGAPLYIGTSGLQSTDGGSGQIVGYVVSEGAYPSGVPGTDVNGDISLGDYLVFILAM